MISTPFEYSCEEGVDTWTNNFLASDEKMTGQVHSRTKGVLHHTSLFVVSSETNRWVEYIVALPKRQIMLLDE